MNEITASIVIDKTNISDDAFYDGGFNANTTRNSWQFVMISQTRH